MTKTDERHQAIMLRETGVWTVPEIATKLCVSKGIVSLWLKNTLLTQDQKNFLRAKNHIKPKPEKVKRPKKNVYIFLKDANNKTVMEHRVIMEEMLCRELTKDEFVHHKNGIKYDNRRENLELTTLSKHSHYHAKPNSVIIIKCKTCGRLFLRDRSKYMSQVKQGNTPIFCSVNCASKPYRYGGYKKQTVLNKLVMCELNKGKTPMDIVREFGVNKTSVYYIMKTNNIDRASPTYNKYPNLIELIKKELIEGLNGNQIAKKYNVPYNTIYRNIKKINLDVQ